MRDITGENCEHKLRTFLRACKDKYPDQYRRLYQHLDLSTRLEGEDADTDDIPIDDSNN